MKNNLHVTMQATKSSAKNVALKHCIINCVLTKQSQSTHMVDSTATAGASLDSLDLTRTRTDTALTQKYESLRTELFVFCSIAQDSKFLTRVCICSITYQNECHSTSFSYFRMCHAVWFPFLLCKWPACK